MKKINDINFINIKFAMLEMGCLFKNILTEFQVFNFVINFKIVLILEVRFAFNIEKKTIFKYNNLFFNIRNSIINIKSSS